jgi:hypothetical protein
MAGKHTTQLAQNQATHDDRNAPVLSNMPAVKAALFPPAQAIIPDSESPSRSHVCTLPLCLLLPC